MKYFFALIISFTIFSCGLKAQTIAEWFHQKATQKKYLLQQIAALQVYTGYVQKGYSIAKRGLNTISDIKNGEFNLHKNYFNSLKVVNPKIRNYSKVAAIILLQVDITKVYAVTIKEVKQSKLFSPAEITYVYSVFDKLLDDCIKNVDELITLTTDGELEMKDDERLDRIEELYYDMQGYYEFVQSFSGEAKLFAGLRIKEQNDIRSSRIINDIKN
ncbi:MAG: hypothetical protein ABI784_03725 [Ginsengibacter sp.]